MQSARDYLEQVLDEQAERTFVVFPLQLRRNFLQSRQNRDQNSDAKTVPANPSQSLHEEEASPQISREEFITQLDHLCWGREQMESSQLHEEVQQLQQRGLGEYPDLQAYATHLLRVAELSSRREELEHDKGVDRSFLDWILSILGDPPDVAMIEVQNWLHEPENYSKLAGYGLAASQLRWLIDPEWKEAQWILERLPIMARETLPYFKGPPPLTSIEAGELKVPTVLLVISGLMLYFLVLNFLGSLIG